jgi:phage terminase large subunit-like protein
VLLDELHEHPTAAMVDLAEANLKTRTQPLVCKITNSGVVDPGAVCFQTHEHGERMLQGIDPNDDSRFFYIGGLDKGDSYLDPAIRKKANPMYDVIPRMDRYLDDAVATAKGMPSKVSVIRRLNFCEWVESADPWVDKEIWDSNSGEVDLKSLIGRPCFGGLDLSRRVDLTALVLVFPDDVELVRDKADEEAPRGSWMSYCSRGRRRGNSGPRAPRQGALLAVDKRSVLLTTLARRSITASLRSRSVNSRSSTIFSWWRSITGTSTRWRRR